jgi:hypothetical protein
MYLLFLDESGQIDQGGLFALGGIAIRDTDWPELRRSWHATLRNEGWPLDKEIKWHGIRKGEVPPALADAIFGMLARAPFTAYVTLLDIELGKEREPDFFRTREDTYATGPMFLAEQADRVLARASRRHSTILGSCIYGVPSLVRSEKNHRKRWSSSRKRLIATIRPRSSSASSSAPT